MKLDFSTEMKQHLSISPRYALRKEALHHTPSSLTHSYNYTISTLGPHLDLCIRVSCYGELPARLSPSVCNMCAGNYWIYSTYGNFTEDPADATYCHPTLYWYAFWLMTAGYIILGVAIVGGCAVMCCMICYTAASSRSG